MKTVLATLLLIFAQKDIYKEGKAQLAAKHYDEAEAEFRQLLAAKESSSKAYEGLALVEIARKNYNKALENASKLGRKGVFTVDIEFWAEIRVTNPGQIQQYGVTLTPRG